MITPIYHELSEKLENYILDNALTGKLPGLGPLSKQFGVHQLTMSKAVKLLEEKGVVSINGTRGTFINEERRPRQKYQVIGLVGITSYNERGSIIEHLNPVAEKSGYQLITITHHPNLFIQRRDLLARFPVDGLIFCYSSLNRSVAEYLRSEQIPMVICNRWPELAWLNRVDFDHEKSFDAVFRYLNGLGHRRVAFVEYGRDEEYQGHLEMMRGIWRKNLDGDYGDELFYVRETKSFMKRKYPNDWRKRYIRQALEHFLSLKEPPTAIVAEQGMNLELYRQIKELKLRVPKDISLLSIANRSEYRPQFTTLLMDEYQIQHLALLEMLGILAGKNGKQEITLCEMPLKTGKTTGRCINMNKEKLTV